MATLTLTASTPSNTAVLVNYAVTNFAPGDYSLNLVLNDIADDVSDFVYPAAQTFNVPTSGIFNGSFTQSGLVNGVEYTMIGSSNGLSSNVTLKSSGLPLKPVITIVSKTQTTVALTINAGALQGSPIVSGMLYYKTLAASSITAVPLTIPAVDANGAQAAISHTLTGLVISNLYEVSAVVTNSAGSNSSATVKFTLANMLPRVTSIAKSNQVGSKLTVGFSLPSLTGFETTTQVDVAPIIPDQVHVPLNYINNRTLAGVSFNCTMSSTDLVNGVSVVTQIALATYTPALTAIPKNPLTGIQNANREWVAPSVTFDIPDEYRQFVSKSYSVKIESICLNAYNLEYTSESGNVSVDGIFGVLLTLPLNNVAISKSGAALKIATKLYFNSQAELDSFNSANVSRAPGAAIVTLTTNARWVEDTSATSLLSAVSVPNVTINALSNVNTLANATAFDSSFSSLYFGKKMKLQLQSISASGVTPYAEFVDAGVSRFINDAPVLSGNLDIQLSEYNNGASFLLRWGSAAAWGETGLKYSLIQTVTTYSSVDNSAINTDSAYPNDYAGDAIQAYITTDASGAAFEQAQTYQFKLVAKAMNANTNSLDSSNALTDSLPFGNTYIKDQGDDLGVVNADGKATISWKKDSSKIAWVVYLYSSPNYVSAAVQSGAQLTTVISTTADMASPVTLTNMNASLTSGDYAGTNGQEETLFFRQSINVTPYVKPGSNPVQTFYSEIQEFKVRPLKIITLANQSANYEYTTTANVGIPVVVINKTARTLAQLEVDNNDNTLTVSNIKSNFQVDIAKHGASLTNYSVIAVPHVADSALMAGAYKSGTDSNSLLVLDALSQPTNTFSIQYAGYYMAAIVLINSDKGGAQILIPAGARLTAV